MTAVEIIEEFKRLPQTEKDKVVEFIQQVSANSICYASDEAAKAASEEVFTEHPELFSKLAQ
ncbi:MAG: hypothetical protein SFY80_10020 [Verrucomicrobiota bacterium]|nr:hypothetical protein [Verrucomicrobiota bacterium]